MQNIIKGRVWVLGDDIDTDIIMPTEYLALGSIAEMAPYAFEPLCPQLASQVKQGDILVGGENFGCGSSREQAPEVLKELGFACIIAKSFARIFFRNAVNNGILPIECPQLPALKDGDVVCVAPGEYFEHDGQKIPLAPMAQNIHEILAAGGLISYVSAKHTAKEQDTPANSTKTCACSSKKPYTMIEKILMRNAAVCDITAGEIVVTKPNRLMVHDIFVPFVDKKFQQMGFDEIWDTDALVLIHDHLVPAANTDDVRHLAAGRAFAARHLLPHVHETDGICHQLMVEKGYVKPGDVVFGTDSHTTTYGAVGAFSTGIGYTEMAAVLGTGRLWVRVPHTIRVEIEGELSPHVSAKDIILRLLMDIGADGAVYKCLEFAGSTVQNLSLSSRMTIANMAVEAGAKCALFAPDAKSLEYCGDVGFDLGELCADTGASYARTIRYDAQSLEPLLACPSRVDLIKTASELSDIAVDEVFIGSCTNGRLEDLRIAADILRGKKIAPFTRLIITPASRSIYTAAANEGLLEDLIRAGATVTMPGCGLCCGRNGGILTDGEVVVATNNRNFMGRMGPTGVQIYLSSPAVAATSALTGFISVPK